MFSKEIENLDINYIRQLIENEIPESSYLDYKEQMIGNDKLAKLMIAFANSSGGLIYIGIKEKRNEVVVYCRLNSLASNGKRCMSFSWSFRNGLLIYGLVFVFTEVQSL